MSKLVFGAPERNKKPILEVLQKVIPEKFSDSVNVLEVAAGTGQHAAYFCENLPSLKWQPTDLEEKHIQSIKAYIEETGLKNMKPPFVFDISKDLQQHESLEKEYHVVVAINLIHISPWKCTEGLFETAGKLVPSGGMLVTYGPYAIHGEIYPESNVKFNESLKAQNPEWGLRDIDELEVEAKKHSFVFDAMFDMPANNKTLVWLKKE